MRTWLRRLRGFLGTTITGTFVGALLGGVLTAGFAIVSPSSMALGIALGVTLWMGVFGGFAAGAFAVFLSVTERKKSLDQISVFRCASLGAVAGALFPLLAALLTNGSLVALQGNVLASASSFFAVLGAGLSASLVGVAKNAERKGVLEEGADSLALHAGDVASS